MGTHNPWQTQWPGSNYRCQIKIGSPQCGASDKAESYHVLGWAARQCGCVQLLHAATARSSQPISPCFSPCNPETSPTPASQFHPTHPCYQPKGTQMPSIKKKKFAMKFWRREGLLMKNIFMKTKRLSRQLWSANLPAISNVSLSFTYLIWKQILHDAARI